MVYITLLMWEYSKTMLTINCPLTNLNLYSTSLFCACMINERSVNLFTEPLQGWGGFIGFILLDEGVKNESAAGICDNVKSLMG